MGLSEGYQRVIRGLSEAYRRFISLLGLSEGLYVVVVESNCLLFLSLGWYDKESIYILLYRMAGITRLL